MKLPRWAQVAIGVAIVAVFLGIGARGEDELTRFRAEHRAYIDRRRVLTPREAA